MSQFDYGTINPNTKSGTQLASDLNDFRDALHSNHLGTSQPSYVVAGMVWGDNNSANYIYKAYDGSDDIPVFQLDATNNVARVALDNDGDTYIVSATDDEIDFYVVGALDFKITANSFVVQSGSKIDLSSGTIDFSSTSGITDVLDEDTMSSDSATALATQQSIKAYVDTSLATDVLKADTTDELEVGFTTAVHAIGNSGTGTQTVSLTEECLQSMTINGSFTLAPPSSGSGVAIIDATNDGTGGYTMTTSGFTKVNGSYDNTASKQHRFIVTKIGSTSILDISEIA